MLRFVGRVLVVALAATSALIFAAPEGFADTKCQKTDASTGICLITVVTPSSPTGPGPTDTGLGAACYWDPAKQGLSGPPAGPVLCTSSKYGYWSDTDNCYVQAVNPQPAAGDPEWQGHQPGDGAVYDCYQPQTDMAIYFWAQNPPPSSGAGPSPRDVAQLAINKMNLKAIDIGITPMPGPNSVGLVGMPVWMWAQAPSDHTYGPITASASAGGIAITATAKVLQVTWDMGDGTQVVCSTAGLAYLPSFGGRRSPDCGHVYRKSSANQSGGNYTVSATSEWVITWSGAGQTGTIRLGGLTRSTSITIGEAQVLVN